ncbi:methyltransferase [Micromonospora sp. RTGN7]|uniref:methyltransferase n=1 Tax=Micromonospora sp. RTGN7 TaxID=3016526 RepID=UPI0029FED037|nr:methyltransferase [Micromonospora sp. RTGN7]
MSTTPIDTSRPAGIIRLANSFCDAKALLTAVELGLFTILRSGPATEDEIREKLGLHGRGLSDWLGLLVELSLLERADGRYRNAAGADRFLVNGEQSYIGGFLERSNRNLYPAWGRLADALRTGQPQSGSSFDAVVQNPRILSQFINSMDALTRTLGPQLINAYEGWGDYHSVLDVGGCRGSLAAQIVTANPNLSGHVFDLPQMEPFFTEQAAETGLTDRLTFHGGSFFTDPLPSADIVVMGHVLHDWDREQRGFLIEKAFQSVNPGGVLLVYDRMLDRASSRVENLVISLDMLLVTDGGSEYPVDEVTGHANRAGFAQVESRLLGDDDTLVVARKEG